MPLRRTLWLLYALFIVYGGTIPFHFAGNRATIVDRAHRVTLNPFVSPDTGRRLSLADGIQNVLLFVPFGALGMLGAKPGRHFRRLAWITVLGFALSTTVETAQLLTVDRIASPVDIGTNTVGTLVGALGLWWSHAAAVSGIGRLRAAGLADVPELRPLAVAVAAIAIAYWQPCDVTLEVGTVVGKVRALQTDVWQFNGLRDEGTSIILSVFFSTTLAGYLSVLGETRAALKAALIGSAVVCALEGSQLFIGSRMPSLWDAAVGMAGIGLGSAIWAASGRVLWPALWFAVIVAATAGAAALQMLSPFEWTREYHSIGLFPFLGYYGHTTFEALSHVIELVLLYLPVGFFIGQGSFDTRRAIWLAAGITLALAGPIEYLQGWVVGRYPDVTDIAISVLGAVLGSTLASRVPADA